MLIQTICLLGIILSVYLLYVNKSAKTPFCDLSSTISCTSVIRSHYGKLFGVENARLGIIFYTVVFILSIFNLYLYIALVSLSASIIALFLLYAMIFKIRKYCIVCIIADVINLIIFFASIKSI